MKLPYWHVDAFADRPFGGNPAGVLLLDTPLNDPVMQEVAAEVGLAATAFVAADGAIRWFSPCSEIALCGHGALAAGHVLLGRTAADSVAFQIRSGQPVEVRREGDGYALALPAIATAPSGRPEVAALLGLAPREVWSSPDRYGIYLFADEAAVRSLAPDFEALARCANDQFICTAPGQATDIVSRVFVGGAGAREDAVTGSAHAALAPFWVPRLRRESFTAHQASDRGGRLTCRLDGARVWLAGRCETVVEGAFYLPG